MEMAAQGLMKKARQFQNSGNAAAAAQLYLDVLKADPGHVEACFQLGTVYARLGRLPDAIASIHKAMTLRPGDPTIMQACGSFLIEVGRFADAVTLFDRALALRPDATPFLFNRGLALALSGRAEAALADYDRAIALRPAFTEAWLARGNLLRQLGRVADALASFDRALECDCGNISAHHARGLLLSELDRGAEALQHFDWVLERAPGHAGLLFERGRVLRKLNRAAEALQSFDAALARDAGHAQAWNARGTVLADMGRREDALASYSNAIARDPAFADALVNRGLLQWTAWRRYGEAVADLERAVALSPRDSYARGELFHIRMYGADWRDFDTEKTILDEAVRAGRLVVRPFAYQAISQSPQDLQSCARIFARLFPAQAVAAAPVERKKIRVGYLSADFRDHATSYLMAGLYERHDRTRFDIVAIDNGGGDSSPMRERLADAFGGFVGIAGLSDSAAAARIRAEEIDILVNLNGYFGEYRMGVFAQRPAPVQVNYLGFPGTLGAPYIDYLIADRTVIPEAERRFYDEQLVWMPGCYQANDDRRTRPGEIPGREACGLPEDAFVFCNFNQSYKLMPDMFAAWMRILLRVPRSVLWLLGDLPAFRANVRKAATAHGVAAERIIFAGRAPVEQHLARLTQADLVLDSLPYNAHTTASDALWMGVPLLTCRGTTFPGRVAASMLAALDMNELVTENKDEYEQLAVALAGDPHRMAGLRTRLAAHRDTRPLFDTDTFRRHIEEAYRRMHARALRGEPPAGFSVGEPA